MRLHYSIISIWAIKTKVLFFVLLWICIIIVFLCFSIDLLVFRDSGKDCVEVRLSKGAAREHRVHQGVMPLTPRQGRHALAAPPRLDEKWTSDD